MMEACSIHYGNQLPSPSLFEQYKEEVQELVEDKVSENHLNWALKNMGREKFLSNCPEFTTEEFLQIFGEIYKGRKNLNNYVEDYLLTIYETIFSIQEEEYSEIMNYLTKESFGEAAAKDLGTTIEKIFYSSNDIAEIVNIEKRLLQRLSALCCTDNFEETFKRKHYRTSEKETEDKINNLTLKLGTAVENFTEFIRKFYQIKELISAQMNWKN